jgi:dihydroneopterin triphosphate diphosphatase
MKHIYFVSCFVIRPASNGWQFLQLFRSPGRYMESTWQLCTGGIGESETATAAMLRELKEETGLVPLEFYQLDVMSTFFAAKMDAICQSPIFCAVVAPDATVTLNHENTDHRWVDERDIVSRVMWPGERTALAELKREILNDGPAKPYLKIDLLK